ncbi:MAG: class I SAM-dependent methyltransferase [Proteobacteria bacterium]|nr:class I SAM-dependent methyltransferase [Pseudomonadota bacterium]
MPRYWVGHGIMGKKPFISLSPLKLAIKRAINAFGYDLVPYYQHLPRMWSGNGEFLKLADHIRSRTLVPPERLFVLYQLACYVAAKEDALAEVGVFKGGTAHLVASVRPDRPLHLFDTFEGLPETDPEVDRHRTGDFSDTSLEGVKAFLSGHRNVHFHKGFFPDTAGPVADNKFCLVHVDVDIYQSVRDCLEFFYPRLVSGGFMVFDDYEGKNCPGVRKAIDEFLVDKPEVQIATAPFQCMILKA